MSSRSPQRLRWILISVVGSLALASCAAPFGPSYAVESQHIDVGYPASAQGFVSIRASYRLQNVGATSIASFDLDLPDPRFFSTRGILIRWAGEAIQPSAVRDSKVRFHVPLGSSWQPRVRNELMVSYEVRTGSADSVVNSTPGAPVFLPSGGWYPQLRTSSGLLASGGNPPKKWQEKVSVPQDYVETSSGRVRGRSHQAGKLEIRHDNSEPDYLPFLVAGNFAHREVSAKFGVVSFWSIAAAPTTRAHELAQRIERSVDFLRDEFGVRKGFSRDFKIIECPAGFPELPNRPWLANEGCIGEPGAAIVPEGFLSGGRPGFDAPDAENTILESIDIQLAAAWFDFTVRVDRDAAMFPMAAAADYAAFSLGVSRDPATRPVAVSRILARLLVESNQPGSKSLGSISRDSSSEARELAFAKSELFFIALEDRCGTPQLHRALSRIVRILGGETWGVNDLRSAVEAECGADLGQFFREWLDKPGIPAEFRAKYGMEPPGVHE